jgi:hypothetical protein
MGKAIWLLALMLASALAGVQATTTTQANSNWARNGRANISVSRIFGGHGDAVIDALASTCELVEDYPDDPRGHSCLVLTFEAGARPLHVVLGFADPSHLVVITVYEPDPKQWIDWRVRRKWNEGATFAEALTLLVESWTSPFLTETNWWAALGLSHMCACSVAEVTCHSVQ